MQSKEPAELLIAPRWLLPIAPVPDTFERHGVVVARGRIVGVGALEDLEARFEPRERVSRPDHVLMPGFVNAHTRASMMLLRGLPVQGPLMRWLRETVAPAELRWVNPDFVREGTQLAIAEMLRAGITAFGESYLFPDEAARAAAAARVRAVIGLPVQDAENGADPHSVTQLARAERLWDDYKSNPWVSLYFAPPPSYAISDATLAHVRSVADEIDARIAMPVHETEVEVRDTLSQHGRRPLQRLADLGLLRPGFTATHMNRLDAADLELAHQTGIAVVACPQSDLRLGSGSTPVARLQEHGVPVGLGSDSPATAGALDVLAEARLAAQLASAREGIDERPLSAHDALHAATLGGAVALGLSATCGSIEVGKSADLVCIDLGSLACQPVVSVADAVLFSATRQNVSDVWVAGRAAVAQGRLLAFDEQEQRHLVQQWAARIRMTARTGVQVTS